MSELGMLAIGVAIVSAIVAGLMVWRRLRQLTEQLDNHRVAFRMSQEKLETARLAMLEAQRLLRKWEVYEDSPEYAALEALRKGDPSMKVRVFEAFEEAE